MSVTILVCPCGRRLKVAGLAPGKSGRCPSCGALIRVPEPDAAPPPPTAVAEDEDEWNWQGTYDLGQALKPPSRRPKGEPDPVPSPWNERWPEDLDPADPEAEAEADAPVIPPDSSDLFEDEWNWQGTAYNLGAKPAPTPPPSLDETPPSAEAEGPAPAPIGWTKAGETRSNSTPPPDPWWPPLLFYPLRGAEGVAMVITLGLAFWVMATLVPEYCLTIQANAEFWGAGLMGTLISLITGLPTLIFFPMVLIYWLQYLGRVLTVSFEGETLPPRPPDRNFEGLFDGLASWLLWGLLGLGVGLLPMAAYAALAESHLPWNPGVAVILGLFGFTYAQMALLIIFLHNDPLEANPVGILRALGRLAPSYLGFCLTTGTILGTVAASFFGAWLLRSQAFWLYIGACLGCWMLMAWTTITTMHTLGCYYEAHSQPTRSRSRPRPRTTTPTSSRSNPAPTSREHLGA